jgi:hypothetical protein
MSRSERIAIGTGCHYVDRIDSSNLVLSSKIRV